MVCIDDCWDQNDQRGIYSCPQCRETFTPRPVLRRNNMLAEVVEKLKKTELQAASTAHCYTGPADVECDFCTGRKLKAIKSCLMCQASFCETHLKPHYEVLGLKKHKLVKASSDLQEKICSQHDEMIKIYCRTDQSYICFMCTMEEHRGHDTVSAATERTQKQMNGTYLYLSGLKKEQRKHQQRIQEKDKKVQDLTQAVDSLKRSAQAAVMDSERIFTELIRSIEKKRCEVRELIRDQEKTELSRAEGLLDQLEQEIADLKRRDTELEQLSHTEDHIHFLQCEPALICEENGAVVLDLLVLVFFGRMPGKLHGAGPSLEIPYIPSDLLNNMLAEVVEKLKRTELQAASPAPVSKDVECDFCSGEKLKAIKSCLMCQASFCETHVKPHYEVPGLKKHKLVKASSHLQEKICSQHDEVLKIYCRTDQSYICYLCTMDVHRGHDTVAAVAERSEKQSGLKEVQGKLQQRIQEKEKTVQELKQAVDTLKRSAQAAVEDSERIFTELICSIEKKRCEVRELIRDQEKAQLSQAEGLLDQLEQEIADLKRRDSELQQLSHTEDHVQFLQSFQSLHVSSGSEGSPIIYVHQQLSFDEVNKSLSDLKEQLEELWRVEFNKISPQDFYQLTLDPNTAHHLLSLSEMGRVATGNNIVQPYSDHPERFDYWIEVLSKESVCGRCYWEVECSSEGDVYISVSYKDISRKGEGDECRFGHNSQSWSLVCSSTLSFCHNNIETEIPGPPSSRIGVYVDHSAGTLSFYGVSDTVTLLHTVHTTFTQPLYAGFSTTSHSIVAKMIFSQY
ncbi:hypothetical protein P4O66_003495 [Electrophorus voltai]|uniref:Tripartite motif-containing protein 16-like n=1 Tax=Electrophorus voltai TaxID=2609070 RepID=A0AAD8YP74_9TELE|nr:hypothetical protein P4O66_003495 [Electrophorus voltai]